MAWRTGILALIIIACMAVHLTILDAIPFGGQYRSGTSDLLGAQDPETLLALGERLPLGCADVASLEMISGVSDLLAFGLIEHSGDLIQSVDGGASELDAIKRIRGVGERTGVRLLKYVTLRRCGGYNSAPQVDPQ